MANTLSGIAAAAILATLTDAATAAQLPAIEACRSQPSDAARIACLETALLATSGESAVEPSPAPPASGAEVAEEQNGRGWRDRLPFIGRDRATAPAAVAETPAAAPPATGLGAEDINARRASARPRSERPPLASVNSAVSTVDILAFGHVELTLANGQVWRQLNGDSQRLSRQLRPGTAYTVTVEESRFGGYRMRIHEIARIISVERIR